MKKFARVIFFFPCLLIAWQIVSLLDAAINGASAGLLPPGYMLYGMEAVMHNWVWNGFLGVLYIPFIVYQFIFISIVKKSSFIKAFIIQLVLMVIMEAPLLIELS